ncbi:MAG: 50S ribosomal protein L18 [Verrucomicrobiota bacterium]
MATTLHRKKVRNRIHFRIRRKVSGTAERPRLAVHFSNQHISAQLIDDVAAKTLAAASTMEKGQEGKANVATASKIGALIAERSKKAGVEGVVFDRGGFLYHGKVKALADAAREKGLQF